MTGFGSNPGNLRMFSYVPTGLPHGAPLVVLLHGCKQKAASFARDSGFLALAERQKFALLLPEQKGLPRYLYDIYVFPWVFAWFGANNQNACFNWFEPDNAAREVGEAQSIRQMMDFVIERHAVDRSRVYVAGLSAGGAMTAALLAVYPERFAGGAIVAGVPYGCADTVRAALRCMDPGIDRTPAQWARSVHVASPSRTKFPPLSIWHGGDDIRVVPGKHSFSKLVRLCLAHLEPERFQYSAQMIVQVYPRTHQHSATAQQSSQSVRRLALDVDSTIPTRVKSPRDIASIDPVGLHRHRARRCLEVPGIQTHHWQAGLCQAMVDCR